ncbi:hypothetical protein FHETE_1919 [Fusarium heterosporum]|uniref:Uncharacterized protein n=1 Tax=Fusarium heterosporum TaxID=42747 RepID=A0A8H5TZA5_FUSHE|nr:hypothetical protein FHETE_1919 [Fusarium heterosporum]
MPEARRNGEATLQESIDHAKAHENYNIKPHPITGRLVDAYPDSRTKPMRVLCLVQPQKSAITILEALKQLGYTPYHLSIAIENPQTNMDLWHEALDAKFYGKGKPWGREEFDKILGSYDAVVNTPAVYFVEELLVAYPEAKVIVTERDADSWLRSVESKNGHILQWPFWNTLPRQYCTLSGPFYKLSEKAVPAASQDQRELVRKLVPTERMLEFRIQHGWEPLCKFLGVEIPSRDFPRLDDSKQFALACSLMWWVRFARMVGKASFMSAVTGVIASMVAMWRVKYAVKVVTMLKPLAEFR